MDIDIVATLIGTIVGLIAGGGIVYVVLNNQQTKKLRTKNKNITKTPNTKTTNKVYKKKKEQKSKNDKPIKEKK